MTFQVSELITAEIRQHALDDYPNEACGFVTASGYVRVENIHEDPQNHFRLSPAAFIEYQDALAFVHSHPVQDAFIANRYNPGFFPFCPSDDDMISQIATGMVYGIVVTDGIDCYDPFYWGDFILDYPLYGRNFRHGVEDGYAIIRKWYWQNRSIKLPDFPRSPDWQLRSENLYLNNLPAAGFQRIGTEAMMEGDIGMVQLGSNQANTVNHPFIYLGDGTICHHLPGRLSSRDAVGGRRKEQRMWFRYTGLNRPVQAQPMVI